jgi:hypothetical protein
MKDRVLFKSKEYGHNGHNYCELRVLDDGELRLWVHDGGTNSLICMDSDDLVGLAEQLAKHGPTSTAQHESVDIFLRNRKNDPPKPRKKRKPRADKGVKRTDSLDVDAMKAQKIREVMSNG